MEQNLNREENTYTPSYDQKRGCAGGGGSTHTPSLSAWTRASHACPV